MNAASGSSVSQNLPPSIAIPAFPPVPWVPPGKNPETYDLARVHKLLQSAAYFPIFNISSPATANQPDLLIPGVALFIRSVNVNEQLHRFEIVTRQSGQGIQATNQVGEAIAKVHIQWTPIPDFYVATPNMQPPPWLLNPFMSQRFCMLGGELTFQDKENSGIRAFGTGRTFPVVERGKSRLRIGAAIEVQEGRGKFKGLQGAFCINGYIEPPNNLALNLMIRMMDPSGVLRAHSRAAMTPLQPMADPDPDAVFMMFLGEVDPSKGVELIPSPDGKGFIGSHVNELVRLVRFSFDMTSSAGLRSLTEEGPVVGQVRARLYFNMLDPSPVIPIQTRDGVFTFFDAKGATIGTVLCNMAEGRAMRTQVPGFQMPLFRFAGFGPVLGGTGQFCNADGMMSMNSVVSVFPRTLSNLYVFRFYDPQRKFRGAWGADFE